jgi:hypothetical protein
VSPMVTAADKAAEHPFCLSRVCRRRSRTRTPCCCCRRPPRRLLCCRGAGCAPRERWSPREPTHQGRHARGGSPPSSSCGREWGWISQHRWPLCSWDKKSSRSPAIFQAFMGRDPQQLLLWLNRGRERERASKAQAREVVFFFAGRAELPSSLVVASARPTTTMGVQRLFAQTHTLFVRSIDQSIDRSTDALRPPPTPLPTHPNSRGNGRSPARRGPNGPQPHHQALSDHAARLPDAGGQGKGRKKGERASRIG